MRSVCLITLKTRFLHSSPLWRIAHNVRTLNSLEWEHKEGNWGLGGNDPFPLPSSLCWYQRTKQFPLWHNMWHGNLSIEVASDCIELKLFTHTHTPIHKEMSILTPTTLRCVHCLWRLQQASVNNFQTKARTKTGPNDFYFCLWI